MMLRFLTSFLLLLMFTACGGGNSDLDSANASYEDLEESFEDLKLPVTLKDSSFKVKETKKTINQELMKKFVPDSVLRMIYYNGASAKAYGKIVREAEHYLLLSGTNAGKPSGLTAVLFDEKGKYLNALPLFTGLKKGAQTIVTITSEPTFLVTKQRLGEKDELRYTKQGLAYNIDAASFMVVLNESNEKVEEKFDTILNPIDTFARKNPWSGDYKKDDKNFISIRDGKDEKSYSFFIHFEKNNGNCTGELKGDLVMTSDKTAVYKKLGDACVIDFTFQSATALKVKEQGSCGSHRGIKCFFDDVYKRPKPPKAAGKGKR